MARCWAQATRRGLQWDAQGHGRRPGAHQGARAAAGVVGRHAGQPAPNRSDSPQALQRRSCSRHWLGCQRSGLTLHARALPGSAGVVSVQGRATDVCQREQVLTGNRGRANGRKKYCPRGYSQRKGNFCDILADDHLVSPAKSIEAGVLPSLGLAARVPTVPGVEGACTPLLAGRPLPRRLWKFHKRGRAAPGQGEWGVPRHAVVA